MANRPTHRNRLENELGFAMIESMKSKLIVSDPEIMSGTPCFAGTRVPVKTIFDYLEGGETLDEFLDDFPTVTREIAIALLEEAKAQMLNPAA